jgi:hypothetical protein
LSPSFAPIAAAVYNVGHLSFRFLCVFINVCAFTVYPVCPLSVEESDFEYVGAITRVTKLTLLT